MGLLRCLFKRTQQTAPSPGPEDACEKQPQDGHAPAQEEGKEQEKEVDEGDILKYTFPSPWVRKEGGEGEGETAVVLRPRPSAACASCAERARVCGGGAPVALAAVLDGCRMVLSVVCVVLGVVVMVLLAVTWVLARVLVLMEGAGRGRGREREVGVDDDGGGGSEVVLQRHVGEVCEVSARAPCSGDKQLEVVSLPDSGLEVSVGCGFVQEAGPVTTGRRERRLAFAAARRAWEGSAGGVR